MVENWWMDSGAHCGQIRGAFGLKTPVLEPRFLFAVLCEVTCRDPQVMDHGGCS